MVEIVGIIVVEVDVVLAEVHHRGGKGFPVVDRVVVVVVVVVEVVVVVVVVVVVLVVVVLYRILIILRAC